MNSPDVASIANFSVTTDFEVMVTEYGLNSHGSGGPDDSFDYPGLVTWFIKQFDTHTRGSFIFNFDAFYSTWGPVNQVRIGKSLVDWNKVFQASAMNLRAQPVQVEFPLSDVVPSEALPFVYITAFGGIFAALASIVACLRKRSHELGSSHYSKLHDGTLPAVSLV